MKYKIFAYGSLINQASLKKTVPEARNIIPAKTYGLRRVFNLASQHRYDKQSRPVCVLNIAQADSNSVLNGSCFEMDENSLNRLLEREKGYDFCPIEAYHYQDESQSFAAYYFRAHDFTPYRYLPNSEAQQHYLNLCIQGCQKYSEAFTSAFIDSTDFWGIDNDEHINAIWSGEY